jgi:hypothetical protein
MELYSNVSEVLSASGTRESFSDDGGWGGLWNVGVYFYFDAAVRRRWFYLKLQALLETVIPIPRMTRDLDSGFVNPLKPKLV